MAVPIDASLPPDLDLGPGWTLRVTALSTTDGSVVSGVKVSNFGVIVSDRGGSVDIGPLETGPFMLVPGPDA
jgi:hypothetical protein